MNLNNPLSSVRYFGHSNTKISNTDTLHTNVSSSNLIVHILFHLKEANEQDGGESLFCSCFQEAPTGLTMRPTAGEHGQLLVSCCLCSLLYTSSLTANIWESSLPSPPFRGTHGFYWELGEAFNKCRQISAVCFLSVLSNVPRFLSYVHSFSSPCPCSYLTEVNDVYALSRKST